MLACVVGFLDRVLGRTPERDRARTFTLDACVVHAGGLLGIVGESYRQEELRVLAGRTTDVSEFREELVDYAAEVADSEPDRRWFRGVLAREPGNPKDENAIAVYAQAGGKVGYLAREDARRYTQVFESLEKRGYGAAACPAMLMGGGAGESYGVVLAISALAQVDRATVGINREMCSFLSCLSPSTNCDITSPSPAPSGRSKNPSPASCGDGTGIAFAIDRELKKIVKRRRFRNPSGASPPYSSTQTTSREEWT